MKRYIVILSITMSVLSASLANALERFTLCYEDQDYAPYLIGASVTPAVPKPGLLVELSQKAFASVGFEVDFVRRPWKRCMRMVEENQAVGMFGVIYSKEREKIGTYPMIGKEPDRSRRLLSVDYPIFHHKDKPIEWDGTSFLNTQIKVATPLGYQIADTLKSTHHIEPNTTYLPEAGLLLIAQNKLDGYIVEKNVGMAILRKHKLENIVIPSDPVFKQHELYLFLSHGFYDTHKEKAENIWSSLAVLRKKALHELMDTYLARQ
jgi:polar amino acid transport system substrate-binding protein